MPVMEHMMGIFIFIGLMGSGKTTLGRLLANHFSTTFIDSDEIICQRTGVDIPTIFEKEGEVGFRQREAQVIQELCCLKNIVLATGGGAVLKSENRQAMKQNGIVIYLHTQPETLFNRTQNDKNRPLLQVNNPLKRFQDLYAMRDPLYRETANIILDVHPQQNTQQTLINLLEAIKQYSIS